MPRIPGPNVDFRRGPGQVQSLARPRDVAARVGAVATAPAVRSPLIELGSAIGQVGNMVLEHVVQQDRSATATRLKTAAAVKLGEFRNDIELSGTVSEARELWNKGATQLRDELSTMAREAGMGELSPALEFEFARTKLSVESGLAKRAASEGLTALDAFTTQKVDQYVGAETQMEAQGHKAELHQEYQRVAATNPLFSPADADKAFQEAVAKAGIGRVQAHFARNANDPANLRMMADAIRTGGFEDLPEAHVERMALQAETAAWKIEEQQQSQAKAAEAEAAKALKEAQDLAAADWRLKIVEGETPLDEIQGGLMKALQSRSIRPQHFDMLLPLSRRENEWQIRGPQVDNPLTYVSLRNSVHGGTYREGDAEASFLGGQINQQSYKEITKLWYDLQVKPEVEEEVSPLKREDTKRARSWFKQVISPSGVYATYDREANVREANAMREFDELVLEGRDPTEVAERLANQYTPAAVRVTGEAFGRPRFLVGSPRAPDIKASMKATVDAFEAGEIGEAEMTREIERLEDIESAVFGIQALQDAAKEQGGRR